MEKVMNYLTGFFGGIVAIMMAILPVTILWTVLTGGSVFWNGCYCKSRRSS